MATHTLKLYGNLTLPAGFTQAVNKRFQAVRDNLRAGDWAADVIHAPVSRAGSFYGLYIYWLQFSNETGSGSGLNFAAEHKKLTMARIYVDGWITDYQS